MVQKEIAISYFIKETVDTNDLKDLIYLFNLYDRNLTEVNSMFADERKKVRERYKEYDGCYLGHYAQWFFWFFFTIGIVITFTIIFLLINSFYHWTK